MAFARPIILRNCWWRQLSALAPPDAASLESILKRAADGSKGGWETLMEALRREVLRSIRPEQIGRLTEYRLEDVWRCR
jgi:hypothetical protein